jgi:hypothetical protein
MDNAAIAALVHDQHAKVSKLIADLGWAILELYDRNHVLKKWEKAYEEWVSSSGREGSTRIGFCAT